MKIAFCVYGISESTLQRTEFYRQDFEILKSMGHEVVFLNRPWRLNSEYDIVFVWWWNYLWLWGPFAWCLGIPVVTTGVLDNVEYHGLSWIKQFLKRWGSQFSARNIFVSELERRDSPALLKLKEETLHYSPLVVDTSLYSPGSDPRPGSPSPFTLLNVCWHHRFNIKRKMVVELLEAFALVHKEHPHVRLVLAGPPEDGGALLQARARELGVEEVVSFPGELTREEKIRRMRECSLYCQVSTHEGFGLAIAEAMACGAPVVVSKMGAVPEVVGDCGNYVDECSVQGIRQAILKCLQNPAAIESRAAAGVERIGRLFSVQRRTRDLRQILDEVGSRSAAAPG